MKKKTQLTSKRKKLSGWIEEIRADFCRQKMTWLVVIFLLTVGAWLRLYKINETLMFQGDQGRDALIVARMWQEWDPAFIGPVTSVGNMYLGPFYYYFMLPWLFLSYPSPVGPAVGVALVSVGTIWLLGVLGGKMVGKTAGWWAGAFFTFSLLAINYARFSWNPNLSPLFALLTLFFTHQAMTKPKNWLWVAVSAGLLMQLHYVNLIVVSVAGIFWLKQLIQHWRDKLWQRENKFWRWTLIAVMVFGMTCVPLLLFDWKHGWRNAQAAVNIFAKESSFTTEGVGPSFLAGMTVSLQEIPGRLGHLFGTLAAPQLNIYYGRVWLGLICLGLFLILTWRKRRAQDAVGYQILAVTAVVSVLALAFYRHSVFDHYVLFFLPVLFLILGCLLDFLKLWKNVYLLVGAVVLGVFLSSNYRPGFFRSGNQQYTNFADVVQTLLGTIEADERFGFVLINDDRDLLGEHYRYFFQAFSDQLLPMDRFLDGDYLFVIDETRKENLYDSSSYELVVFRNEPGASVSAIPYRDDGPLLYRLEKQEGKHE